mmetsp:Transcript_60447/g.128126  ORF Transcript_60447/g.128126 Transcript_60447/m.128126 type:complete len:223 (-) Transcript_60447:1255-1923(-)
MESCILCLIHIGIHDNLEDVCGNFRHGLHLRSDCVKKHRQLVVEAVQRNAHTSVGHRQVVGHACDHGIIGVLLQGLGHAPGPEISLDVAFDVLADIGCVDHEVSSSLRQHQLVILPVVDASHGWLAQQCLRQSNGLFGEGLEGEVLGNEGVGRRQGHAQVCHDLLGLFNGSRRIDCRSPRCSPRLLDWHEGHGRAVGCVSIGASWLQGLGLELHPNIVQSQQ